MTSEKTLRERIAELEAENERLIRLPPPRLQPTPKDWTPYAGRTKEEWDVIARQNAIDTAHLPED